MKWELSFIKKKKINLVLYQKTGWQETDEKNSYIVLKGPVGEIFKKIKNERNDDSVNFFTFWLNVINLYFSLFLICWPKIEKNID